MERIAVASSDGIVVNQHFGRAEQFYILDLTDAGYQVIEIRKLPRICDGGNHEEAAMDQNIHSLRDCQYVLVSRIGNVAMNALEQAGIVAMVIPDLIDEAVRKLRTYIEIDRMIYGEVI